MFSGNDPREPDKNEAPVAAKTEGPVFPIYLHKLRVENGGLFFADYSLMPHFATGIHQLDGSIIGMSSESGTHGLRCNWMVVWTITEPLKLKEKSTSSTPRLIRICRSFFEI